MEKWKIAIIAALLLSLLGFGLYQQGQENNTGGDPSATKKPLAYGHKALPSWNFNTWSTKPVSLESLRGKPALVEIFRIQCPHCQDAAPFMISIQNRYGPRGLKIVAIQSPGDFKNKDNPETKWSEVQDWIKKFGVNYPVAFDKDSAYFQGTIKKNLLNGDDKQMLYPTTLLLDKEGNISMAHTGFQPEKSDSMADIMDLVVTLEKLFPGDGSPDDRAQALVKWLRERLPDLQVDGPMLKALTDDIAERLKK